MKLRRCGHCGKYTLMEKCSICGFNTANPHPSKFSPDDPYGEYRRRLKLERMKSAVGCEIVKEMGEHP